MSCLEIKEMMNTKSLKLLTSCDVIPAATTLRIVSVASSIDRLCCARSSRSARALANFKASSHYQWIKICTIGGCIPFQCIVSQLLFEKQHEDQLHWVVGFRLIEELRCEGGSTITFEICLKKSFTHCFFTRKTILLLRFDDTL